MSASESTSPAQRLRYRAAQVMSRRASLNQLMTDAHQRGGAWPPWRTSRWTGGSRGCPPRGGAARRPQICAAAPSLVDEGAVGPVCVLRADALTHNLATMAGWCRDRGGRARATRQDPHGPAAVGPPVRVRLRMPSPSRPSARLRTYRAFGVRDFIVANELVDAAALRWVAAECDADPDFTLMCWVDSVAGVRADGGPAG